MGWTQQREVIETRGSAVGDARAISDDGAGVDRTASGADGRFQRSGYLIKRSDGSASIE